MPPNPASPPDAPRMELIALVASELAASLVVLVVVVLPSVFTVVVPHAVVDRLGADRFGGVLVLALLAVLLAVCSEADAFVAALGSYTRGMVRPLGIKLPIYPIKGYSITVPIADEAWTVGQPAA